jgi:hypothetical protein
VGNLERRLRALEAKAELAREPVPRPRKRELAFARLFRTLDELERLVNREGPLPWDDPRVREIIQRDQRSYREQLERSAE